MKCNGFVAKVIPVSKIFIIAIHCLKNILISPKYLHCFCFSPPCRLDKNTIIQDKNFFLKSITNPFFYPMVIRHKVT